MRMRSIVAISVVAMIVLAACSSSGSSKNTDKGGSGTTAAVTDTKLGPGVTDSTVKIGVALIDFDCIKQFTDTIRTGQEAAWKAFADDINKNQGGMGGRQVELDIRPSCPITANQSATQCTRFAEDDKVFAVAGLVYDTTGAGQACLAKQHNTPLLAFLLSQALMDKAPPGMMVSPGATPERTDKVLVKLLKDQNTLAGKKVAVLAGAANKKVATDSIIPALKSIGVEMGTPALLNIATSGDTTSAQAQLDSFIEKWKSEGVNAVFMSGDEASTKQFTQRIRQELGEDTMLLSDTYTVINSARNETATGTKPNPYEGLLNTFGQTSAEYESSPRWKYCTDIYKKMTGKTAVNASQVKKDANGKVDDQFAVVNDPCVTLTMLKQILDKVGKPLNATNWVNAVNNMGSLHMPTGEQYYSLHNGKYDAADSFRLVKFDSAQGTTGGYVPLTPVEDVPNP
jgi:ABC-type branched-subunit amino acid transport system substrate-binding protein